MFLVVHGLHAPHALRRLLRPPAQRGVAAAVDPISRFLHSESHRVLDRLELQPSTKTPTLKMLGSSPPDRWRQRKQPSGLGRTNLSVNIATGRFQKVSAILKLNPKGRQAQTVEDLPTMRVGAASKHDLRMTFVPEAEAKRLHIIEVVAF